MQDLDRVQSRPGQNADQIHFSSPPFQEPPKRILRQSEQRRHQRGPGSMGSNPSPPDTSRGAGPPCPHHAGGWYGEGAARGHGVPPDAGEATPPVQTGSWVRKEGLPLGNPGPCPLTQHAGHEAAKHTSRGTSTPQEELPTLSLPQKLEIPSTRHHQPVSASNTSQQRPLQAAGS